MKKLTCAAVALVMAICPSVLGADGGAAEKSLVRWKFRESRQLLYNITLGGEWQWTPEDKDLVSGKMNTDFTFALVAKALRENDSCTFDLIGQELKSKAENTDGGSISITADRKDCDIKINKFKSDVDDKANPLLKEMTLTIGPRGVGQFGTGLYHIAIFFAVHVDHRFWLPLTMAPEQPVGVGDKWDSQFAIELPDSKGEPLQVDLHAEVTGWENYNGRKCLAGRTSAVLELKDSTVLLKKGERVHIVGGHYEAQGKVLWDVSGGALCFASAENRLIVESDKPTRRRFAGRAWCTLKLLDEK